MAILVTPLDWTFLIQQGIVSDRIAAQQRIAPGGVIELLMDLSQISKRAQTFGEIMATKAAIGRVIEASLQEVR